MTLAMTALTACHDGPEPSPELEIQVSPDTMRSDLEAGGVRIHYTMRSTAQVQLGGIGPDVQAQLPPGSWTTLVDSTGLYIQDVLGWTISPGYAADRVVYRELKPGRYRLRTTYTPSDPPGSTAPGAPIEALSNAFVVLP